MWRKHSVIVVFVGFLGILIIGGTPAMAGCPNDCELFWTPPATYTDNTAIEPADLPLSFIVEWDGTLLPATTNPFVSIPKPYGHEANHTARVKVKTARGSEGAFTSPFSWVSPAGIPGTAGGIGVR